MTSEMNELVERICEFVWTDHFAPECSWAIADKDTKEAVRQEIATDLEITYLRCPNPWAGNTPKDWLRCRMADRAEAYDRHEAEMQEAIRREEATPPMTKFDLATFDPYAKYCRDTVLTREDFCAFWRKKVLADFAVLAKTSRDGFTLDIDKEVEKALDFVEREWADYSWNRRLSALCRLAKQDSTGVLDAGEIRRTLCGRI